MDDDLKWMGKYRIPSARKKGWDYSSAAWYFITVNAYADEPPFGEIREGVMFRNVLGEAVAQSWLATQQHFPDVVLNEWVVMPDHFHALLWLDGSPLGEIGGRFKGRVTWRNNNEALGAYRWQPRFHDEIVLLANEFDCIQHYIRDNPKNYNRSYAVGE